MIESFPDIKIEKSSTNQNNPFNNIIKNHVEKMVNDGENNNNLHKSTIFEIDPEKIEKIHDEVSSGENSEPIIDNGNSQQTQEIKNENSLEGKQENKNGNVKNKNIFSKKPKHTALGISLFVISFMESVKYFLNPNPPFNEPSFKPIGPCFKKNSDVDSCIDTLKTDKANREEFNKNENVKNFVKINEELKSSSANQEKFCYQGNDCVITVCRENNGRPACREMDNQQIEGAKRKSGSFYTNGYARFQILQHGYIPRIKHALNVGFKYLFKNLYQKIRPNYETATVTIKNKYGKEVQYKITITGQMEEDSQFYQHIKNNTEIEGYYDMQHPYERHAIFGKIPLSQDMLKQIKNYHNPSQLDYSPQTPAQTANLLSLFMESLSRNNFNEGLDSIKHYVFQCMGGVSRSVGAAAVHQYLQLRSLGYASEEALKVAIAIVYRARTGGIVVRETVESLQYLLNLFEALENNGILQQIAGQELLNEPEFPANKTHEQANQELMESYFNNKREEQQNVNSNNINE